MWIVQESTAYKVDPFAAQLFALCV